MPEPVIVPRDEWGAQNPSSGINCYKINDYPIFTIFVSLKSGIPECNGKDDCIKVLKESQEKFIQQGNIPDIPYSFIISKDGTVFEGRGWDEKPDKAIKMEPKDVHPKAFDITFFGDYSSEEKEVETRPFRAMIDLLEMGIKKNYVYEDYDLEPIRVDWDQYEPDFHPGPEKFKNVKLKQKEPIMAKPFKGKYDFNM